MFENTNTVVLKVTRDCNLRCDYCYLKEKDLYHGEKMDFDLYKKIIDKISIDKYRTNGRITLTFHGGEPTMVGKDLLSKMLIYAEDRFLKYEIDYSFSIQTNATLMDDDMVALMARYNVDIGTSFDGIGAANTNRTSTIKTKAFQETFEKTISVGQKLGALVVASKSNIKHIDKTQGFLNKLGIGIKINYVEDVGSIESDFEIEPEEFLENVIIPNMHKYMDVKNRQKYFDTNISSYIDKFVVSSLFHINVAAHGNCYIKFCGSGIRVLDINPDGAMMMCGRYSSENGLAQNGHILKNDFLSINQINRHIKFNLNKHNEINKLGCDTCEADAICDHGCMAFSYEKYGEQIIREDLVCGLFKPMYKLFMKNAKPILNAWAERTTKGYDKARINPVFTVRGKKKNSVMQSMLNDLGFKIEMNNDEDGSVYADLERTRGN